MSKKYTDEQIVEAFKSFNTAHGRYPAQCDLRSNPNLPDSKTLERRFGGIVAFRKKHDMGDDLRKGEARSAAISKNMNLRSKFFWEMHEVLVARFGKQFVHREGKTIRIFHLDKRETVIGYFYPSNPSNFDQGLRYAQRAKADIYVCLNEQIEPPVWPDNVVSLNRIKSGNIII